MSPAPVVVRTGLTAADDAAAAFSGARGGLDMSKTSGGAESEMAGEVRSWWRGRFPGWFPSWGVVFSDRRGGIGGKKPQLASTRNLERVQNNYHARDTAGILGRDSVFCILYTHNSTPASLC